MFENLPLLPKDPILGLLDQFRADEKPSKIDLGVGVYQNEKGHTPIMEAIKRAEAMYHREEETKSYIGPAGDAEYSRRINELIYGELLNARLIDRQRTVQTPGGCGALRLAGDLLKKSNPDTVIWVSDPTWANHIPLFGHAGLEIKQYPYYDPDTKGVRFDAMMECLQNVGKGDVVLLHACCHNPTGADLNDEQWRAVAELAQKNGFLPLVDIAYQGFGAGLEEDAYGIRLLAESVPELIVASSCSKNFGLYRERVGALSILSHAAEQADATLSQALALSRGNYSMPPSHGAALVTTVLASPELDKLWRMELNQMRERMLELRALLVTQLAEKGVTEGFEHINTQRGMFSYLGLPIDKIKQLREEYGVYMTDNSRINVAGISHRNIDYLSSAIAAVL
jgi:aspartate aminotransferase